MLLEIKNPALGMFDWLAAETRIQIYEECMKDGLIAVRHPAISKDAPAYNTARVVHPTPLAAASKLLHDEIQTEADKLINTIKLHEVTIHCHPTQIVTMDTLNMQSWGAAKHIIVKAVVDYVPLIGPPPGYVALPDLGIRGRVQTLDTLDRCEKIIRAFRAPKAIVVRFKGRVQPHKIIDDSYLEYRYLTILRGEFSGTQLGNRLDHAIFLHGGPKMCVWKANVACRWRQGQDYSSNYNPRADDLDEVLENMLPAEEVQNWKDFAGKQRGWIKAASNALPAELLNFLRDKETKA